MNSTSPKRPIGIFDSGIGGLTVANAINKLLPHENIIYFGDTAHLPYGDKSPTAIKHYCSEITKFLVEKNCKMIIVACNTASSHGFTSARKIAPKDTIMTNVIDPVVRYVGNKYDKHKIGVIGTKGAINSRVYARRLVKHNPKLNVASLATPLLAPMIEEGFYNNYISKTIINSYLDKKNIQNINAIILGCTHYPLIKKEVRSYYKEEVEIIDSAQVVAKFVKHQLTQKQLLSDRKILGKHQFFVSDFTSSFEKSTKIFFKSTIHLKKVNLWK